MAKRVCIYGILTALCMVLGYIESIISLSFIALGIKLGLANAVPLLLIVKGDIKGGFLVNITRIILTALLFSSPFSLVFSLFGGLGSMAITILLSRLKSVSVIGFSIAGGTIHNIFQIMAALLFLGHSVIYYLPVLILSGGISGGAIGALVLMILKKMKTKYSF